MSFSRVAFNFAMSNLWRPVYLWEFFVDYHCFSGVTSVINSIFMSNSPITNPSFISSTLWSTVLILLMKVFMPTSYIPNNSFLSSASLWNTCTPNRNSWFLFRTNVSFQEGDKPPSLHTLVRRTFSPNINCTKGSFFQLINS